MPPVPGANCHHVRCHRCHLSIGWQPGSIDILRVFHSYLTIPICHLVLCASCSAMPHQIAILCRWIVVAALFGCFFLVPPMVYFIAGAVACLLSAICAVCFCGWCFNRRGFGPFWLEFLEMMLLFYCLGWSVVAIVALVRAWFK